MDWIWIAVFLGYVFVGTWAVFDAYERTDIGCVWLGLFICLPGLSVIAYVVLRFFAYRGREAVAEIDPREYATLSRFGSEIEKARFIEAASQGPGTLYEPSRRKGVPAGGFRHFTDARAETLIEQGLHGEAFDYLIELYSLAGAEKDGRAQDTYLHYIHRLPGGAGLLKAWHNERRIAGQAGPDGETTGPKREVPF